jgi:phosphohistidine phosphatase
MKVYLVQHGEAEPKERDPERGLTERGREEVRRVAGFVKRADIRISEIRHSGKLRAEETAAIFGEHLAPERGVAALSGLGPTDDPRPIMQALGEEDEDVMLVGHLPFMERLASIMMAGKSIDRSVVRFHKGGVICLARGDGDWVVDWMVTPSLLSQA